MSYQSHKILGKKPHNKWALRFSCVGCVLYGLLLSVTYTLAGFLHMTDLIPGHYSTDTIALLSVIFIGVTATAIGNMMVTWNYPVAETIKLNEEKKGIE